MRISYLRHLSCPLRPWREPGGCGGRLGVRPGEIPLRAAEDDADELLEGNLVCERCGAWFPVLAGVALLVAEPRQYLGQRFSSLMAWASVQGNLSAGVLQWLAQEHFDLYDIRKTFDKPDSSATLHYERVLDLMAESPIPESFRAFLEEWDHRTPFDVLVEMAARCRAVAAGTRVDRPEEQELLVVDAGCGAGGLVGRLAGDYDVVFGVDLSFSSVLMARSLLLHRPQAYTHLVRSERNSFLPRDLDHARRANVEVVVADCKALPFKDGAAAAVASANVIEIVHPRTLLREAGRVLSRDGLLLFTDPFRFLVGDFTMTPRGHLEETRSFLEKIGLQLVVEQDFVPWIWYEFQRQVQIYFNYCGVFRKA